MLSHRCHLLARAILPVKRGFRAGFRATALLPSYCSSSSSGDDNNARSKQKPPKVIVEAPIAADQHHKTSLVQSPWAFLKQEISQTWRKLLSVHGLAPQPTTRSSSASTPRVLFPVDHHHQDASSTQKHKGAADQDNNNNSYHRGPTMYIPKSEGLTGRERMQKRLSHYNPIIQDILQRAMASSKLGCNFRAETRQGAGVRKLREQEPDFTLEEWCRDIMVEGYLPVIMKWILQGNSKLEQLRPWLGEETFRTIAAEMKARQQEKIKVDERVLRILDARWWDVWAVEPGKENQTSPTIILHFICEQIDCVWQAGQIVEGSEDEVTCYSYVVACQRELEKDANIIRWKVVDFQFNGPIVRHQLIRQIIDSPDYFDEIVSRL